jgi:hypothetical protein
MKQMTSLCRRACPAGLDNGACKTRSGFQSASLDKILGRSWGQQRSTVLPLRQQEALGYAVVEEVIPPYVRVNLTLSDHLESRQKEAGVL